MVSGLSGGTAEALPENSRGKDFDDPRLGGELKKSLEGK
jgi:hypothetical protein